MIDNTERATESVTYDDTRNATDDAVDRGTSLVIRLATMGGVDVTTTNATYTAINNLTNPQP